MVVMMGMMVVVGDVFLHHLYMSLCDGVVFLYDGLVY